MRFVHACLVGGLMAWFSTAAMAQPTTPPAGDLWRSIERLQVVGTVLYVAAHPDDENTRLISWLVGDRGLRTAYLSMTRGGGGQNLIGSEQAELLGVLRTGELLAARAVDGGEQWFTRMRDFGYSKNPDETFARWGRDEALDDVVRAIRTVRPDIIVTRFNPEAERGHGHHTASAILAGEAFVKAADPSYETAGLEPWAARRLLHNQSTWWLDKDEEIPAEWLRVDVGTFDPLSGRSWGEVAAASRTMHKSQGFGSAPRPGPELEYFTVTDGDERDAGDDPFGGLEFGWSRFPGTEKFARALEAAATRFDPQAPHAVLPWLARAHRRLDSVPDPTWRERTRVALERLMVHCAGAWLTARTEAPAVAPGGTVEVVAELVRRSPAAVDVREVRLPFTDAVPGETSAHGWSATATLAVPHDTALTRPMWLRQAPSPMRYTVEEPALRNLADGGSSLVATFDLRIAGVDVSVPVAVQFARTDPVRGEVLHDLEVLPPITASFEQRGLILVVGSPTKTQLTLRAPAGPASGELRLALPDGVSSSVTALPVTFEEGVSERTVDVVLTASPSASPGPLVATVEVSGRHYTDQQAVIDHPHLPRRTVLTSAELALSPVDLARGRVTRVGYLPGSGDRVPHALRTVGYDVEEIDEALIRDGRLSMFDAVVLGVRAYNTRPGLPALHGRLMEYVSGGGRLVVQYNTSRRWGPLSDRIGPAPLEVGRGRVTDESAAVTFQNPEHPAIRGPNALTSTDFEGWVQERGLYFVEEWDDAYEPLFAMADPDEEPLQGSTLIARHGNGAFVYTGLSFFRQLPAGVPGAMRLFANLLAAEER